MSEPYWMISDEIMVLEKSMVLKHAKTGWCPLFWKNVVHQSHHPMIRHAFFQTYIHTPIRLNCWICWLYLALKPKILHKLPSFSICHGLLLFATNGNHRVTNSSGSSYLNLKRSYIYICIKRANMWKICVYIIFV